MLISHFNLTCFGRGNKYMKFGVIYSTDFIKATE